jgi:SAM-dependent methyltransferase
MSSRLTASDYERSCTSFNLPDVRDALSDAVAGSRPRALLDVGCGYGGVAADLGDALDVAAVHGVDIDGAVIDEARAKGVDAVEADVGSSPLPYPAGMFDLVTCFGMLDFLPWYDVAVREFSRVLVPGGIVAVALPNLASWHNRVALLLGYQPRDVEFCSVRTVGIAPFYRSVTPVGHVHTATTRAFREFMVLMGFDEVCTRAIRPRNKRVPVAAPFRLIDALVGRFPSAARRFLYVGRQAREPASPDGGGWWSA